MSALRVQDIFQSLQDAGLSVSLAPGGGLAVSPRSQITPDLRELVKGSKAALVNYLQAANDEAALPAVVADPSPEPDLLVVADSAVLGKAYYAHHVNCKHCIAAGRGAGYGVACDAGQLLWDEYQTAVAAEPRAEPQGFSPKGYPKV